MAEVQLNINILNVEMVEYMSDGPKISLQVL
jgi:hypothetical protein